jgi:DNA repair photolyase
VSGSYRYALSLTSQFPFCSIPFRLDTFSKCQFACRYCFAAARGGNTGTDQIQTADIARLDRSLSTAIEKRCARSVVGEMLSHKVPIHFGGMSDPFTPLERTTGVSLAALRLLARYRYPTVISTKSDLVAEPKYLSVIAGGRFIVQVSLVTLDARLAADVDVGTPSPGRRLESLRALCVAGVVTACRLQPLLPGRETDAYEVIDACAAVGVRHVSVEHLKLPIEHQWAHRSRLDSALGTDLLSHFKSRGAFRVGREWILPISDRLPRILDLREHAHRMGMTFGAADNDLLHLSDGNSCCSGADLNGFDGYMRFNYSTAVKSGLRTGQIDFASISRQWRPEKTIARFVNSRCRPDDMTINGYLRANWNGRSNGNSPLMFFGVERTGMQDSENLEIYRLSPEALKLLNPHPYRSRLGLG